MLHRNKFVLLNKSMTWTGGIRLLKLNLISCSFTRSEIQGAAIFEDNEIDKKKSQHNAPHHGIFQDEKFPPTGHRSTLLILQFHDQKRKPNEKTDKPRLGVRVAMFAL